MKKTKVLATWFAVAFLATVLCAPWSITDDYSRKRSLVPDYTLVRPVWSAPDTPEGRVQLNGRWLALEWTLLGAGFVLAWLYLADPGRRIRRVMDQPSDPKEYRPDPRPRPRRRRR